MYVCVCICAGFIETDFYFYKFTRYEFVHYFFFNFHLICFSNSEHCFFNRMEFFVAIGSYMVGFSIEGETDSNIEPFPDEINIVTNVEICYKK